MFVIQSGKNLLSGRFWIQEGKILTKENKYLENFTFPYNLEKIFKILRRTFCFLDDLLIYGRNMRSVIILDLSGSPNLSNSWMIKGLSFNKFNI